MPDFRTNFNLTLLLAISLFFAQFLLTPCSPSSGPNPAEKIPENAAFETTSSSDSSDPNDSSENFDGSPAGDLAESSPSDRTSTPEATGGEGSASPDSSPPPDYARYRRENLFWTDGKLIRTPAGESLILRGWNLSQAYKRPPYFGKFSLRDYERISAQWGFNSIRLIVTWAGVEPTEGKYSESYLSKLRERLQWAKKAGLFVILDMHQDLYGEGFGGNGAPKWTCPEKYYRTYQKPKYWWLGYLSSEVKACFTRFWKSSSLQNSFIKAWLKVAEKTADFDNIIGYDLYNEPYWGNIPFADFHKKYLQPLYERLGVALRSKNPRPLIFVEPTALARSKTTPFDKFKLERLVYAPHYYHPSVHNAGSYDGNPTPINRAIDGLASDASALGLPLWLGEYGGPYNTKNIELYMRHLQERLEKHLAGGAVWNYDYGHSFAPLDSKGNPRQPLLNSTIRPYPRRVAGILLKWRVEVNGRISFTFRKDKFTFSDKTVVFLPPHLYRGKFSVATTPPDLKYKWNPSKNLLSFTAAKYMTYQIVISPR